MEIVTSRFGPVEIDEERILSFPKGLVGFPTCRRFALIQTNDNGVFFWMQSLDRSGLAFVVCDPRMFVSDYRITVKSEELEPIGLDSLTDAQVLVIVNKIDRKLTGNLQGPLLINVNNMQGRQLVLSDKKYETRREFMDLSACKTAMSKTA